jgi:hypothetical protein
MKQQFCTLFNSAYLSRGLALYESLIQSGADFHLYVFAFDQLAEEYLNAQVLSRMTVIGLADFEDQELLRIKASRSAAEYCWTCTPSTILYCIEQFSLDHCTYIDADMYFYHDPAVLLNEMGEKDVLITEHAYTTEYDQSKESGRFCVQYVVFRNTTNGMKVLRWWRDACIEWCYARAEDGKFGDQKYLDDWETRFDGVHVLKHPGGGVAPWNVQQYEVFDVNGKKFIRVKSAQRVYALVFFHFHGLKFFANHHLQLSGSTYELGDGVRHLLFFPYIRNLRKQASAVYSRRTDFDSNGASGQSTHSEWNAKLAVFYYLSGLKKSARNIFGAAVEKQKLHHHFYRTDSFSE